MSCSRVVYFAALLLSSSLVSGCATTARLAPMAPLARGVPVPLQQEQIAGAAREAVAQAVGSLDYTELQGKKARVQVSGVFPPSDKDLLDFVGAAAESEMARRGVRIEPRAVHTVSLVPNEAALSQPDFVTSISLDTAGVDVSRNPRRAGPIALLASGGGAFLLGASIFLAGLASGSSYYSTVPMIVGSSLGGVGLPLAIIGAIWLGSPPATYEANARVRLEAIVQPVVPGIRPQGRSGSGARSRRYEAGDDGEPVSSMPAP